ncbi:unnamed protein product [Polarella glacialis]|uniref:Uncharacterized protein n=1 Tax=Polarella glacialis TaxID=89957 RepID=A0A813FPG5_POLGL|nr:unnamed protein product [Polarella glacialis]CAE8721266.1 unnamed protein product [Polarella glacialis]
MPIKCRTCGADGQHFTHKCPQNAQAEYPVLPASVRRQLDGDDAHDDHDDHDGAHGDAINLGVSPRTGSRNGEDVERRVSAKGTAKGNSLPISSAGKTLPKPERKWLIFKYAAGESSSEKSLQGFLKLKPSQVDWEKYEFLNIRVPRIENINGEASQENTKAVTDAWERSCLGLSGDAAKEQLFALASGHKMLVAKWLFSAHLDVMDVVWPCIASAVASGSLGFSAKVGGDRDPARRGHICCVYLENFMDTKDVHRVRDKLSSIITSAWGRPIELMLKPDLYTRCGIYSGNRWKVPHVLDRFKTPGHGRR